MSNRYDSDGVDLEIAKQHIRNATDPRHRRQEIARLKRDGQTMTFMIVALLVLFGVWVTFRYFI